jgi:hypothetical protein
LKESLLLLQLQLAANQLGANNFNRNDLITIALLQFLRTLEQGRLVRRLPQP